MRELPSVDPKDPEFVRINYVRYADDWIVGVTGSNALAEEIKEKIGQFLKSKLNLTLSQEKTRITSARNELRGAKQQANSPVKSVSVST